ncbi:MAG: class I SAM-dependent methyltransferase [Hyphomicrobiaceae bacterium]|nr:class I SAM-dependent methyltransferase [Hyphomicrobiaceae bacterium]
MDWYDVTSCNHCGGTDFKLYMESSVPTWYAGRPMRLIECTKCGYVPVSPRPDPIFLYRNYISGGPKQRELLQKKLDRPNVLEVHRTHVETAQKYLGRKAKTLYDMGCGAGTVMMGARDLGIEAAGNDVNKVSVDMLREMGLDAKHGFTKDLDLPADAYDIVMNFDYLEHSYEPFDDLKTCYRITRPGGILYLKTLYLGCPDHVAKGEAWHLLGQGHFSFFTADALKAMIKNAGFKLESVKAGGLITVVARK